MIELVFFSIPFLALAFAIFTNLYREHRRYPFALKPNCLLTRKPVVFITGPRSIFYFRKYWNAYPEILAEHGYEVFTLALPWRGQERSQCLQMYLEKQAARGLKYHFICDRYTSEELRNLFEKSSSVASLTILEDQQEVTETAPTPSFFLGLSYRLHGWACRSLPVPAGDLGIQFPSSTEWLLQRMQEKGEQDFLS